MKSSSAAIDRRRSLAAPLQRRGPRTARRRDGGVDLTASAGTIGRPARRPRKDSIESRSSDTGYLTLYFRDMSSLEVLRPLEEFTAAREFEELELSLWRRLLSVRGHVPQVLDAVEPSIGAVDELRAMRRIATDGSASRARYDKAVIRCSAKLREIDIDRLLVDAALREVARLGRQPVSGRRIAARELGAWASEVRRAAQAVRVARNDFVKANLRLVISIARRFNHGRMPLADLIQEGNLGLIKAVERYDHRRGFRFSTYASWWIRHAISRALADKGREIRLPVHMIDAHHRLTKARRELTAALGRPPGSEELAAATGFTLDKVEDMRRWMLEQAVSIDRPVSDDDGRTLAETLVDPEREGASPTSELEAEASMRAVRSLLEQLRPIEAEILRQRFGLDCEQELTLKEIGEKYDLSRERIRQLQEQALQKMRRALVRKGL